MGKLDKFLERKPQEESLRFCVLEPICYELHGLEDVWKFDEHGAIVGQTYVCGFIPAGTIRGCPKWKKWHNL